VSGSIDQILDLSFSHDAVKTVRIDWFEALDDIAAPRLQSIICEEMDPELIIGSDIVRDVLSCRSIMTHLSPSP
jgi:hypothetical protein